jgi:hypothetical protein
MALLVPMCLSAYSSWERGGVGMGVSLYKPVLRIRIWDPGWVKNQDPDPG